MALAQSRQVDMIGISRESGKCVLSLVDEDSWQESHDHMVKLQEKLNTYLAFIESGELLQQYPKATGRPVVVGILHLHPIPENGLCFLKQASVELSKAGIGLEWEFLPSK